MKKTEKTFDGELVIVRAPHQRKYSVTRFFSFDEAWDAYLEDFNYREYADKAEVIRESGFDAEFDSEELAELYGKLESFSDGEPIVEFGIGNEETTFYRAAEFSKKDALNETAGDDMYWHSIFYAEPGETYGEFAARIYDNTRNRHNEPSMSAIVNALWIDEEEEEEEE